MRDDDRPYFPRRWYEVVTAILLLVLLGVVLYALPGLFVGR